MNLKKKVLLFLITIIITFAGMLDVKAKTYTETPKSDRKCSNYFNIIDVTYGENIGVAGGGAVFYDSEDFIGTHWINGKHVSSGVDNYWTSTGSNVTAWYYYDAFTKFTKDAKVTITVYNKNNSNLCTETITGFNTNETHFKLRLQHNIRSQWVNIKGTFSDHDGKKTNNAKVATEIKVDQVKPEIIDKGGTWGSVKVPTSDGSRMVDKSGFIIKALVNDTQAWGHFHSAKATSCTFIESGNSKSEQKCGLTLVNSDEIKKCENGKKECKNLTLTYLIPSIDKDKVSNGEFRVTFEAIKESGAKRTETFIYPYDANSKNIVNTTKSSDSSDPNICPNGASRDKNGNCADDKDSYGDDGVITKADYVKNANTDKSYDIEAGNIGCTQDIKDLISDYWKYVMILAPIGLMLLIVVDFVKAITSSSDDQLKKSANAALKRTIATVVLLMLPVLLRMVLDWFGIDLCL